MRVKARSTPTATSALPSMRRTCGGPGASHSPRSRCRHLWHGDADNLAPAALGRLIAGAIPGCEATICPGEGHAEPLTRLADEIMATMAD
jgi:hypothetical protein